MMGNVALLVIDFQNDYFPGGLLPLENVEQAAANALQIVTYFRNKKIPIVFVRHEFKSEQAPFFRPNSYGAQIHERVSPLPGEPVILKHEVNSFFKTNLQQALDAYGVDQLVICGAMSHMCVDAAVRAAHDLNYQCTLIEDACATKALEFNGMQISAKNVHAAFMAALQNVYAKVETSQELLARMNS